MLKMLSIACHHEQYSDVQKKETSFNTPFIYLRSKLIVIGETVFIMGEGFHKGLSCALSYKFWQLTGC